MLSRSASVLVLAAALAASGPVSASEEFPRVEQNIAKVELAAGAYRTADADADKTRIESEELAHRITIRKKDLEGKRFGQDPVLARLLEESAELAKRREAQVNLRDTRRVEVDRRADDALRAINDEVARLKPGLRVPARQAETARQLRALVELRKRVEELRASSTAKREAPQAWSKYLQATAIDPADDSEKLRQKEAYVQDLRDKFKKRRLALEERATELKTEREILRAAQDFHTDTALFDEQSRGVERVPRGDKTRGGSLLDSAQPAPTPQVIATPPQAPAPPGASPPPNDPALGSDQGRGGTAGETASPTAHSPGNKFNSAVSPSTPLPKQIDPSGVLSLDSTAISNEISPESVASLLAELKKLDAFLEAREKTLRDRAKKIEADDAKALDSP